MKILRPLPLALVLALGGLGWCQGEVRTELFPSLRFQKADIEEVLRQFFGTRGISYGTSLDLPTQITLQSDNLTFETNLARILSAADATTSVDGGVFYVRSQRISIDVDFEEVEVNRALAEVGRQAKRRLRVIPKLQGKVSLRLRGAPLSTVLSAIAGPLGVGVRIENGVYVLDPKTPVPGRLPAIPHDTVLFVEPPVTFQVRNEEVRNALRRLFRDRNLDFVIDPSVQGSVTVDLQKVPFREAMRQLLEPVGARMQRTMHVIEIKKGPGRGRA
ncbi:MAG: hypothetical protein ACO1SV_03390 [Fimbriimonas sp.]